LQIANSVSEDYDRLVMLFEDLNLFLHRLKVLDENFSHLKADPIMSY